MKHIYIIIGCVFIATSHSPAWAGGQEPTTTTGATKATSPVLQQRMPKIDGQEVDLGEYQGQVLLIVNVASKCGLTPQYKELEELYGRYKDQGFVILAFPANNFGSQEPGSNADIKKFCSTRYNVTFDLFAKVSVKGDDQCDLYKTLTDSSKTAVLGGDIRWNFTKFLVDRRGHVVARFEPRIKPLDNRVVQTIEKVINGEIIEKTLIDEP